MNIPKKLPLFHPAKLLGTWFGVGLVPKMSGTAGSVAALPFAYIIQKCWGSEALLLASVILFFVGWIASNVYLRYTDVQDPREIVIDEVAGQWLLLSMMLPTFNSYVAGILLFRFFDIIKPWPISIADQKIHGGFGVMFDDILAAVYPVVIVGVIAVVGQAVEHPVDLSPLWKFLAGNNVF